MNFKKILGVVGILGVTAPTSLAVVACNNNSEPWSELNPGTKTEAGEIYEKISKEKTFTFNPEKLTQTDDEIVKEYFKNIAENIDLEDITITSKRTSYEETLLLPGNIANNLHKIFQVDIDCSVKYLNFKEFNITGKLFINETGQAAIIKLLNNSKETAYDFNIKGANSPKYMEELSKFVRSQIKNDLNCYQQFTEQWWGEGLGSTVWENTEDGYFIVSRSYNGSVTKTYFVFHEGNVSRETF